jgi:hypothetical protein
MRGGGRQPNRNGPYSPGCKADAGLFLSTSNSGEQVLSGLLRADVRSSETGRKRPLGSEFCFSRESGPYRPLHHYGLDLSLFRDY